MTMPELTLSELLAEMERARADFESARTQSSFAEFCRLESLASRELARADLGAIRVGATFYVRFNNSLIVYWDVPEASSLGGVIQP